MKCPLCNCEIKIGDVARRFSDEIWEHVNCRAFKNVRERKSTQRTTPTYESGVDDAL